MNKIIHERVILFTIYLDGNTIECKVSPDANTYQLYGFLILFIERLHNQLYEKMNVGENNENRT